MLSAEENPNLTQVGPGTPCGEMLRRYWWPVAVSADVGASPIVVTLLGEQAVLFRDGSDALGLLDKHCTHRGASLEFGRVEKEGLRCCYHGWLYNRAGGTVLISLASRWRVISKTVFNRNPFRCGRSQAWSLPISAHYRHRAFRNPTCFLAMTATRRSMAAICSVIDCSGRKTCSISCM
jgi:nitrite reductase/ring-hydroxylating ferredoxin subunit